MASQEAQYVPDTEVERVSKVIAKYVEFPQFAQADLKKGYFCASCIYFWEGHDDCALVYSKGDSADGVNSEKIAPYGMCQLWKPNWDVMGAKKAQ